jgi:hypothetical protein
VIKYADDEGDYVTISSDEELLFAVDIAKDVLRLRASLHPTSPALTGPESPVIAKCPALVSGPEPGSSWWRGKDHREVEGRGNWCSQRGKDDCDVEGHGNWCSQRGKWRRKHDQFSGNPGENRIQSLTRKREKLQQKLAYLESLGGNCPHPFRRDKIAQKIAFISTRLQRLTEAASSDVPVSDLKPCDDPVSVVTTVSCDAPASPPSAPLPNKQELQAQIETQQAAVGAARLALRQASLQLQLQRANFQAAQRGQGPAGDPQSLTDIKTALAAAKEKQRVAKEELGTQAQRMHLLTHQMKAIHQQEKAEFLAMRAAKKQQQAALRAEKLAQRKSSPETAAAQGAVPEVTVPEKSVSE